MANWNTEEYDAPLSSSKGWNSERYEPISQGEAIRRGLLNGVTLGAAPYLGALGHMTQGGTFNQGLAQEQTRDAAAEDQHPSLSFLSNAVGSIPSFGLGARGLKYAGLGNFGSQVALNSGAGSVMGAFQPTQNDTFGEHFQNAAQGASLGALTGLGIHAAGVPQTFTKEQYQKFQNWRDGHTLWENTGDKAWNIHDQAQTNVLNDLRKQSQSLEGDTSQAGSIKKQQVDNILNAKEKGIINTNQVGEPGTIIKPSLVQGGDLVKTPIVAQPVASVDDLRRQVMDGVGKQNLAYTDLSATQKKMIDQGVSQLQTTAPVAVPQTNIAPVQMPGKPHNFLPPIPQEVIDAERANDAANGIDTSSLDYITPSEKAHMADYKAGVASMQNSPEHEIYMKYGSNMDEWKAQLGNLNNERYGLTPSEANIYQNALKAQVEALGGGTTSRNYVTPADIHQNLLKNEVKNPSPGGAVYAPIIQQNQDKWSLPGAALGLTLGAVGAHYGIDPLISELAGAGLGAEFGPITAGIMNRVGLSDKTIAKRALTLKDVNGTPIDIGSYPEDLSRTLVKGEIPTTTAEKDQAFRNQYLQPNNQNLPTNMPVFPAQAGNIGPQTYGIDQFGKPTILLRQGFENSNAGIPNTMGLMQKLELPGGSENLGTATSGQYSGFGSLGATALGNAGVNQVDQNYQVGDRLRALINDYMQ